MLGANLGLLLYGESSVMDIAIISEDGKIIQTSMKSFLLLLLRNATKHNSIKFSAERLHVSSDKF